MQTFFATTAKSLEPFLEKELMQCGAQKTVLQTAGVSFSGTWDVAYRACLWSRVANRILWPLKTVPAQTPEELYEGVQKIQWSDHLGVDQTFAVECSLAAAARVYRAESGSSSRDPVKPPSNSLSHSHYAALKVKDAIVDQFRAQSGNRPSVSLTRPDIRIQVYVQKGRATISLDLSGESLHQRGYRDKTGDAPLKENLAAALLMAAGWPDNDSFSHFVDPMVGSGTFLIEAAWMAARIPPASLRTHFGFSRWLGHQPPVWKRIREETRDQEVQDQRKLPKMIGYDRDPRAVSFALQNIENAGLVGKVHVEKKDFVLNPSHALRLESGKKGLLVMNPPYGHRLGELSELTQAYAQMGEVLKTHWQHWDAWILTGNLKLIDALPLKPSRRMVFYQGALECRFLNYELYS